MKKSFNLDFFDSPTRWLILFAITFLGSFFWLPAEVPLFYSQALPEEKLADKFYLLVLPALVLGLFVVSKTFLQKLSLNNQNMLKLLQFLRIGFSLFCYILFIRIILLVL